MEQSTPLVASAPTVRTVTAEVYQPLAPGVPETTSRWAVGAVASRLMVSGVAACGPAGVVGAVRRELLTRRVRRLVLVSGRSWWGR